MAMSHTREMQVIAFACLLYNGPQQQKLPTGTPTDGFIWPIFALYNEGEGKRVVKGDSVHRAESTIQTYTQNQYN